MSADVDGALPVRVEVDARLAAELVPHLEGTLGWQVTRGAELPAALVLVGVGRDVPDDVPAVVLVRDDDPPDLAADTAAAAGRALRWPQDRDRLPDLAGGAVHRRGGNPPTVTVRVGGAAGGVGTTTVALALGGLLAWHGQPTLVVASGDVPVPDVPLVDPTALAAHRTWDAATPAPGVDGLRVLAVHPGPRAPAQVPRGVLVVRDDGVGTEVDLLVCTRDRAGLDAVDATSAAAVVVADRGAVAPSAWGRATAGRARQVAVPWSTRVARAGAQRRVPGSLPGRWLTSLDPLARSILG